MTPKEQEIAIGEVEERVDRLRVLYDQYFLGFEKLEPTVPRKDLERRMALLRKEQIRNTAQRFRLNVVTQKYNTYSMYWLRIARQIEEGTFKRHLRKAEARFGGRQRDLSIDVDITEFDDFEVDMDQEMDMDSVLAEANAAAEAYERGGDSSDTVPPPPSERAPASVRLPSQRQVSVATPGTSFVVGGRRESLDDMEPNTPPPDSIRIQERTARPAPLPAGSKGRIVLRKVSKGPDSEPGSAPGPSTQRTPAPQPAARPRMESSPGLPPQSQPGLPPQSNPRLQPGPGGFRAPGAPGSAPSGGRIPVAAPPPATSERRIPVAPPPGSERRIPVPANAPGPRPAIGRIGAAQPAPPPAQSSGRTPVAAPSRPNAPPGSAPGSNPGSAGAQRPPARPSIPDDNEKDTIPPGPNSGPTSRPSIPPRSRAPLPLPSQIKKK